MASQTKGNGLKLNGAGGAPYVCDHHLFTLPDFFSCRIQRCFIFQDFSSSSSSSSTFHYSSFALGRFIFEPELPDTLVAVASLFERVDCCRLSSENTRKKYQLQEKS
jgi:hypothetical protein